MSILVARHLQQGRSQRGVGQGWHGLEDKVQQFRKVFRNGVQKLYGPEISGFLPRMLQFLDNLGRVVIFF